MGQDVFLKLGESSVKGGAEDASHDDYIEISSFSLSVSNKQDKILLEGERMLEGASIEALSFSKKFDNSSAKILKLSLDSKPMANDCIVHFCKPSGSLTTSSGLEKYMVFTLESASVQNYSLNAGGGFPNESFSLQFQALHWEQFDDSGSAVSSGTYERPLSKLKG